MIKYIKKVIEYTKKALGWYCDLTDHHVYTGMISQVEELKAMLDFEMKKKEALQAELDKLKNKDK